MASPSRSSTTPPASTGFTLAGEVESEAGFAWLRINGQPVPFSGSLPGPYHFSEPYAFAQGATRRNLLLEAEDTRGTTASLSVEYRLDTQPPTLALDQALESAPAVNRADQNPYPLGGHVADAALAGFSIAGQAVGLTPDGEPGSYRFATALALTAGVDQEVLASAVDRAGSRTERLFVLRAEATYALTTLVPSADQVLPLDSAGSTLEVGVRLDGSFPAALAAVLLDASDTGVSQVDLGGDGPLRGADLALPAEAGVYRLEVRALDAAGDVLARSARRIELVGPVEEALALVRSEPEAGAEYAEPNTAIALYFNPPIDRARLAVAVHETVHGQTYADADASGTDPIEAKGYQLVSVERSFEPVSGSLSLLPGGRTLGFYPERELAYGAEVFVDIPYDSAPLAHFSYRSRPLPTFVSGLVQDIFGQGVPGVDVALPGQGRRATTDRNGGFAMGFGDGADAALAGGRWELEVNPGMALAGYGSRRQWISIDEGRRNDLGALMLAPLNRDVAPVPVTRGAPVETPGSRDIGVKSCNPASTVKMGASEPRYLSATFPPERRDAEFHSLTLSLACACGNSGDSLLTTCQRTRFSQARKPGDAELGASRYHPLAGGHQQPPMIEPERSH